MKRKKFIFLVICFAVSFTLTAQAQDKEQDPQLWYCSVGMVKPYMVDQYVSVSKELISLAAENNFLYSFYTWYDGNFNYYYFYPVKDFADINKIRNTWSDIEQKWEEEKEQSFVKTLEYYKEFVFYYKPDLSYDPENPRLKAEERKYAIWDMFYVIPGKEKEIEKLSKELIALLKSKNYDDQLFILVGDIGFNRPVYIGEIFGKDPTDFWTQNKKMWELMGEEGGKIFNKWMSLIKKREFRQFWYIESLSYTKKEE